MEFKKSKIQPLQLDWSKVEEGSSVETTLKSFSYSKDYCFATFVADNNSIRAIVGNKADYPIKDMMELKGISVEIIFLGTRVTNGVTYPRFSINF